MQLWVSIGLDSHSTPTMIIGWIIHRPNRVIMTKYTKCFLPAESFLNVKDLFVKKLKTIAIDVDMKLLANAGRPNKTNVNKIIKSIAVLAMPTIPKRTFSACFFIKFFNVTFLDVV